MNKPESQFGLNTIASADLDALFLPTLLPGTISAWCGHIPFAQWCIQNLRPQVLVELGTHNGVSYSAFCSAVKRYHAPTRCFAVDTWEGDTQAGHYSDQVFQNVPEHNELHFNGFSTLLRMTFDEALGQIEDGTVDLLHIDGFHSYEAVSHDFETWRGKLSPRAVVLFHDTHERKEGFGVWQFWSEIRSQYPWFEFQHSHGLGVLAVGPQAPEAILALCAQTGSETGELLQQRFALVGGRWEAESSLQSERNRAADQKARLRQTQKELSQAKAALGPTRNALENSRANEARLRKEVDRLKSRLGATHASRSWRLTAPLRAAATLRAQASLVRPEDLKALPAMATSPARLRRYLRDLEAIKLISRSGLFDSQWYGQQYGGSPEIRNDPVRHYVKHGVQLGFNPSSQFDTRWYLAENPDVASAGLNPLAHFLVSGQAEGRLPKPPANPGCGVGQ